MDADIVPERLTEAPDQEYVNKMLRHLLEELAARVCSGPDTEEYRTIEIEKIVERLRPYLKEPVKV